MAFGNDTFSSFGAAASSLMSGDSSKGGLAITAQGMRITAQGTRLKAQGNLVEAGNYDLAATLAHQNEQFTEQSTAIKQMQSERQIYQTIGGQRAQVGGGGLASSGSALDLLADSSAQGALTHAVVGQQGLITEAGYDEQAKSYENLASYGRYAATTEFGIADQQDDLASRQQHLARMVGVNGLLNSIAPGLSGLASLYGAYSGAVGGLLGAEGAAEGTATAAGASAAAEGAGGGEAALAALAFL